MPIIIAVKSNFIRIYNSIIILHRNLLHSPSIPGCLAGSNVLRNHLIPQPILQSSRPSNPRPILKHIPIIPNKLIRVPRNNRPRPNITHNPNHNIPKTGQLIQPPVPQLSSNFLIVRCPITTDTPNTSFNLHIQADE